MTADLLPCRPNCALACPVDEWSPILLDDASTVLPRFRLSAVIVSGRVPEDRWHEALGTAVACYGIGEVIRSLHHMTTVPLGYGWTVEKRHRCEALLSKYRGRRAA